MTTTAKFESAIQEPSRRTRRMSRRLKRKHRVTSLARMIENESTSSSFRITTLEMISTLYDTLTRDDFERMYIIKKLQLWITDADYVFVSKILEMLRECSEPLGMEMYLLRQLGRAEDLPEDLQEKIFHTALAAIPMWRTICIGRDQEENGKTVSRAVTNLKDEAIVSATYSDGTKKSAMESIDMLVMTIVALVGFPNPRAQAFMQRAGSRMTASHMVRMVCAASTSLPM